MKILLVNKFHYPRDGVTIHYFDLARILTSHGHEVAFFSTKSKDTIPSRWSQYFASYTDLTKKYGFIKSAVIGAKLIYNWEAKQKLHKLLQDFKPDVAHLHNIYYHLTPSIIDELKEHNIPVVMTLHDYQLISPNYTLFLRGNIWEASKPSRFYRCITDRCVKDSLTKSTLAALEAYIQRFRHVYGKVDWFITPSLFLKAKFQEYGFIGNMSVVHNPVDMSKQTARKEKDYVLYTGRLSEEKGIDIILKAMQYSKETKLVIAGTGPQQKALQALSNACGLTSRVRFVGFKTGEALEKLIEEAKAIVVPSIWYENFPYAVTQSLAKGKLVIASRIGGIPEIIEHEKSGLLFSAGNEKELADILQHIDTYLVEAIKKRARQRAKQLSSELFYGKVMKIYAKAGASS